MICSLVLYIDLESFGVRRKLVAPAEFFRDVTANIVILDEIQSVKDVVQLVEAALQGAGRRVLFVSSSPSLLPSRLSGKVIERQRMTRLRIDELPSSEGDALSPRLHGGGLPSAFLSEDFSTEHYGQWVDSFLVRISCFGCLLRRFGNCTRSCCTY